MVHGEQICHPISDCSSILFSPSFLRALQPLHNLALSPAPLSASTPTHAPPRPPPFLPYSPILTPSPCLPFSHFCKPPNRQLWTPSPTFSFSLSLRFILSPLFLSHFSLTHSFPVSLTSPLAVQGGCGVWRGGALAVVEQDEFLIAVGQHGDLPLVRVKTEEREAKAAEQGRWRGQRKTRAKKHHLFFH